MRSWHYWTRRKRTISPPAEPEPEQQPPAKPTPSMISKAQFDKVASELAKVKKELHARMTAEEQKEADRMADDETVRLELETLRKEKTLSSYKRPIGFKIMT